MRIVRYTSRFRRDYKREQSGRHGKRLDAILLETVNMLTNDEPLPRRYFDHPLGGACDGWDAEGPGSTFQKYYAEHYDLALSYGLDPALKPTRLDISETVRWLGYKPAYSLANLLSELAAFGDSGPPHLTGS
jgi:Bacterial toxin of type II toxin-antitoxin system, YafQ